MSSPLAAGLFWTAALSCAIAQTAIVRAVIGRRSSGTTPPGAGAATGEADPPARVVVPPTRPLHTAGEVVWAIVPAIALAVLLAFTWRAMRGDRPAPAATPGTTVSITGP